MISVLRGKDRGHARHGWLESFHSFSFGGYFDPKRMGFRSLRVINDDRVDASQGFPMHPHRDMEILSYVLEGSLAHKDSMGNGSTIVPGDVQRMSAGRGVTHSEFNPSHDERAHFLQIWMMPNKLGAQPSYDQKHFSEEEKRGRLRLIASPGGEDGSVAIHNDSRLYATVLHEGDKVEHVVREGRGAWIHVARGTIRSGELELTAGDAIATEDAGTLTLEGVANAEVLVFDMA